MAIKEVSIGDVGARAADADQEFHGDKMMLNIGPSHPATHGVLRMRVEPGVRHELEELVDGFLRYHVEDSYPQRAARVFSRMGGV